MIASLILSLVGLRFFGLPGLLGGFFLGYCWNHRGVVGRARWSKLHEMQHETQFFEAVFSVLACVMQADGAINARERRSLAYWMAYLGFDQSLHGEALRLFRYGQSDHFNLDPVLADLFQAYQGNPALLRFFVEVQLKAALSDGPLQAAERQLLIHLCQQLQVPIQYFAALASEQHRVHAAHDVQTRDPALAEAYQILGISQSASILDIKQHYRRLMNQHHPDKCLARGLSDSVVAAAKEKTQIIRAAYDQIRQQRQFR